jgi:hypothetical protein
MSGYNPSLTVVSCAEATCYCASVVGKPPPLLFGEQAIMRIGQDGVRVVISF